ncbi:MAG: hypothetical protein EXX96DRAFT_534094 [Benjaminiella poitrasii]|nr:MAG: hypothetical protein EXX96DRAFT_534094 [Benjaminiella poitrasii]
MTLTPPKELVDFKIPKNGNEPAKFQDSNTIKSRYNAYVKGKVIIEKNNERSSKKKRDWKGKKQSDEEQSEDEYRMTKRRDYLQGRVFDDELIESPIEWFISGYNAIESLLKYREECKVNAQSNYLDSDIESLHYNILNKIREGMIKELKEKYVVDIDFKELDKFQDAANNTKKALKAANEIKFNHENYQEMMGSALYNINESRGSRIRREGEGLKSDCGLKIAYKDFKYHLLHVEIKGSNCIKDSSAHHPNFLKLFNILKDEIDLLLMEDCLEEIRVFGILIGSYSATVYVMDLGYTHLYRLYEIGSFHIPCSITDLSRLDCAFDSLITLMELYNKSSGQCLEFMKKEMYTRHSPRRRSLSIKSFRSPQKKK